MKLVTKIGQGAYGSVYMAYNTTDSNLYAVKRNFADRDADFLMNIRELDILCKSVGFPYIVQLKSFTLSSPFQQDSLSPVKDSDIKDDNLYFILELGDSDMEKIIHKDKFIISDKVKRYILHILLAVEYLHSLNIIHRDIKPANIIYFKSEDVVKLTDFGLARPLSKQGKLTPRMVTYNYRAPEILFQKEYSYSADIWSVGCVMYEMLTNRRLIRSSNNESIKSYIDSIPGLFQREIEYVRSLSNVKWFQDKLNSINKNQPDIFNYIPSLPDKPVIIELLNRMLRINPNLRYSPTQLLDHRYFEEYRELINSIRAKYKPIILPLNIWSGEYRNMLKLVITKYIAEYDYNILFLAIDLYDRFIDYIRDKNVKPADIISMIYVSIYLSVKYYTTSGFPPTFDKLIADKHEGIIDKSIIISKGYRLELLMLNNIVNYQVYRPTLYDAIDIVDGVKLNKDELKKLLDWYLNITSTSGITYIEMYKIYKKMNNIKLVYNGREYMVNIK